MRGRWHIGNRFILLPEGKRFLPALFAAIDEARTTLYLELYLMESGTLATRLIDALCAAAERGVSVRLLLDGYGSMKLSHADRERLREGGVALRFFNPLAWHRLGKNLSRDHRKLLIVDERLAFTGGFGAVDAFVDAWYEVAVRIEGPVVADWVGLFAALWESPVTRRQTPPRRWPRLAPIAPLAGGMRGRMISGRGHRYQAIRYSLHQRIATAERRMWLCTPYFVPTFSLRRRLIRAARQGLDVRLLLPGSRHDHPGIRYAGQRFYARLLRAGVRIYEFQPSFIHAKFVLVDDWTSIGSCNFDHWSLQWNLEANQEVEDTRFANDVAALFERNFATSDEIHWAQWQRRPWTQRCREWVFGTLNGWMTRLR
ncbi:phosphatidylserine/phosphatidylglycerophosphate/cardiolipin synthase-like enzyme [Chromohalobacter marismortui]|uniref:Phosphatidylserine/phosphatidylglycerophosphate/ cardiolipin synthase-like enzyme n=1 Tax=Chromohalobacter marismortui TaxID=42055 RepID=A0A4R7NTJ3_9GAMM|nr:MULTISPECIES: phospholipase D-like domain-containing protein [Chromohalobacter]MCI0509347.1 phospholipase D-like domain-containing protein [Chromohalobacter sp.]MCI0592352.1 phospholipase D-like domain-containing protein [Chromohalobacter sp.]TDU23760.1 phosphatidylserine/phosphatidylglycerophosphate/cardiolipin synthase-like enzyme [Chromohalobacter marismortui]